MVLTWFVSRVCHTIYECVNRAVKQLKPTPNIFIYICFIFHHFICTKINVSVKQTDKSIFFFLLFIVHIHTLTIINTICIFTEINEMKEEEKKHKI